MRPTVTGKLVTAALALAAIAPPAHAQAPTPDPRESARSRLGPFYLTPTFTVEELGLDTNVFNNETEEADFTATLAPHLDVSVPFGRRGLVTSSTFADFVYYNRYSSERAINPDFKLRGELSLNRVTLFIAPAYSNARRRPSLEIDARARHQRSEVTAGATVRISDRLSLELGSSAGRVIFDEDAVFDDTSLRDSLNRRTRSVSLAVRHEITPLTSVNLRTQFNSERFPFSTLRDADTVSVMPSLEFKPLALVSGSAAVGVRRFRSRSGELPNFTGLIAHANLSYTLKGSTRFRFMADRDLAYSYLQTEPYYTIDGYGVAVDRHIGGRFVVTGGGDWQTYTYRSLVRLDPRPTTAHENRTTTWSLGVGYRLARSRRLGFDVTYRERSSTSDLFVPYSGLRVMWAIDSGL